MKDVLRIVNDEGSKKLFSVLKSSRDFSSVVGGLHGEFYVLRGKLDKVKGKAIFDSNKNIGKIIAQIKRTEIEYADFSFSSKDHKDNAKAREAFVLFLNKVFGAEKNLNLVQSP
jgi:hypothetical protein